MAIYTCLKSGFSGEKVDDNFGYTYWDGIYCSIGFSFCRGSLYYFQKPSLNHFIAVGLYFFVLRGFAFFIEGVLLVQNRCTIWLLGSMLPRPINLSNNLWDWLFPSYWGCPLLSLESRSQGMAVRKPLFIPLGTCLWVPNCVSSVAPGVSSLCSLLHPCEEQARFSPTLEDGAFHRLCFQPGRAMLAQICE